MTCILVAIASKANTLFKFSVRQQLLPASHLLANSQLNNILQLYSLQTRSSQRLLFMDLISLGCYNSVYAVFEVY